jgi:peptidoglycan/xylan/chitin deacetylase (PgdA/CDA1 family)
VIHYDDGHLTDYTKALPVHTELGIPAISNVITGFIDNGPPVGQGPRLTWSQAREMRDSGIWSIGNHTLGHIHLTQASIADIRSQVETGYARILKEMGEPPLWFAPPYHETNKNVEIVSARLHARARSSASGTASQGAYTFTSSVIMPWDAKRYPGGLAALPGYLNDLYYRTVIRGDVVHLYMHEITPTNTDNGFNNIGEAEHRALLDGIRQRNVPVLDARALAYPRLNMLDDQSFEEGGPGWTLAKYNGTPVVRTGQADAHSGSCYLRLANAGASGSGPNVRLVSLNLPVHITREWRFTCWVRASRATGGRFRADALRGTGLAGVATSNFILTANGYNGQAITTGWQKFSTTFDVTGYNEVSLYLEGRSADGRAIDIDVDSMSLIPSFAYDINGETLA